MGERDKEALARECMEELAMELWVGKLVGTSITDKIDL